jgi:hypothetical protein
VSPASESPRRSRGLLGLLAVVPAGAAAILPWGACPACWPAYAAVLGSLGMGFLLERAYLLPATLAALGLGLAALAYRARSRRGHGPWALWLLGATVLVLGKFVLGWTWLAYGGVGSLLTASVWNAWPARQPHVCPNCRARPDQGRGGGIDDEKA